MAREEKSNVINRDMNKDEKLKALDAALTQICLLYTSLDRIKPCCPPRLRRTCDSKSLRRQANPAFRIGK